MISGHLNLHPIHTTLTDVSQPIVPVKRYRASEMKYVQFVRPFVDTNTLGKRCRTPLDFSLRASIAAQAT